MNRVVRVPLSLLFALVVSACGDDPAAAPEPFETFSGTVAGGGWVSHALETPAAGTMRAVLTWPDGDIDLDLYLTDAACTGYPPDDCTVLEASDAFTGTRETVQRPVGAGESYKVWVDSWSAEDSTYEIEVAMD